MISPILGHPDPIITVITYMFLNLGKRYVTKAYHGKSQVKMVEIRIAKIIGSLKAVLRLEVVRQDAKKII